MFWDHVEKTEGCWLWTGGINKWGYGTVGFKGHTCNAHRVSYALAMLDGMMPPRELQVCHACDNRRCVRPDHLWLGTALENTQDKIRKGRARYAVGDASAARQHPDSYRGARHYRAWIDVDTARRITTTYAAGQRTQQSLADEFGMSQTQVSKLVRGVAWQCR